jgi:hypothetical protein
MLITSNSYQGIKYSLIPQSTREGEFALFLFIHSTSMLCFELRWKKPCNLSLKAKCPGS